MKSGAHPTGTEVTKECFTNWFWAGHGFTGCGKLRFTQVVGKGTTSVVP